MNRQTVVVQEGNGPSKMLVLHTDGEVTRIEVTATYGHPVTMKVTPAEGHHVEVEGLPT